MFSGMKEAREAITELIAVAEEVVAIRTTWRSHFLVSAELYEPIDKLDAAVTKAKEVLKPWA